MFVNSLMAWPVTDGLQRHGKLYWPIITCLAIGMVVYAIAMATLNTGARYFAMMWTPVSNGTGPF
jgi:hypothetical protein